MMIRSLHPRNDCFSGGSALAGRPVEGVKPGSVNVDLAGEAGANCELSVPGEVVVKHDVTIVSPLNLPATMPEHASALYGRVQRLLELMADDESGTLAPDFEDEVVAGACSTRGGDVVVHEEAKRTVEAVLA